MKEAILVIEMCSIFNSLERVGHTITASSCTYWNTKMLKSFIGNFIARWKRGTEELKQYRIWHCKQAEEI